MLTINNSDTHAVGWWRRWRWQRHLWTPRSGSYHLLAFSAIVTETITIVCQVVSLTERKITLGRMTVSNVGAALSSRGRGNLNQILWLFSHHQFPMDFLFVCICPFFLLCHHHSPSNVMMDFFRTLCPNSSFLISPKGGEASNNNMQYYCIKRLLDASFKRTTTPKKGSQNSHTSLMIFSHIF